MQTWKTKTMESENIPLIVRFVTNLNPDLYSPQFQELAAIVHHFSNVSPNGLPDADYNDKLFSFDRDIRNTIEKNNKGITVLVETFAGKRSYYAYLKKDLDLNNALIKIKESYPNENLSWTIHLDPNWNFIKDYRVNVIKE